MTITAPTPGPSTAEPDRWQTPPATLAPAGPRLADLVRRLTARLVADRTRLEVGGLAALLSLSSLAYFWGLSASGYANSFYAAAVEAGAKSWKAFFFGSLDASNFITVDKPPASLWVMDLSARVFGFSSWSMLAPEALMGVATVALVYGAVRRWSGPAAGLIAGAVMAATPVAALMFRFNNPDAMLTLLLAAGAYCVARAIEATSTRWLVATGAVVGFAFLAKMGEALLVVPAFGLAYLVAAPTSLRRRLWQLLLAGAAMVASAGWWVLAVSLWPVGSRPMIDGSPTNSIWGLIVGYNGLSRLEGSGTGGGGANFAGSTGFLRLFNSVMGGQASWLLPAAGASLVAGLVVRAKAPRTDLTRAALVIWGGWLVVAGAVFSFSQGIIHTYYTVVLAPPIAALVGIGAAMAWRHRRSLWARGLAAGVTLGTAVWADVLLDRTPNWAPWLRPLILGAAVMAVAGLLFNSGTTAGRLAPLRKPAGAMAVGAVAIALLAGPVAYTAQTVTTAHTGSIPSAGPASANGGGFGGPGGAGSRGQGGSGFPGRPPGGTGRGLPAGGPTGGARRSGTAGGPGAGGGTANVSTALVKALENNASHYRWVAATDGSQTAAELELATGGDPVMAIGGFNNNGGNISLATFETYVHQGLVHYYIAGGGGAGGAPGAGPSTASTISSWVASHFHSKTIGGETVYDLTSPLTN